MKDAIKISCAKDVLPFLNDIAGKQQKYFLCISLNGANEMIEKRVVTIGLLDKSPVHPGEVFADVISDRAASVIFAHKHPSGDLQPSEADLRLQEQRDLEGSHPENERVWAEEAGKRWAAYKAGRVPTISYNSVKAKRRGRRSFTLRNKGENL